MKFQWKQYSCALLAALIWGTAFVAQDLCADLVGPFTFNALRATVGALALGLFLLARGAIRKKVGFIPPKRDKKALLWLTFCAVTMIYGAASGKFTWQFYPVMRGRPLNGFVPVLYLVDLALGMTPVFLHWQEERNWKKLQEAKA